jgi:hypothetical protein
VDLFENSKFVGEYRFEGFDSVTGEKIFDKTYKNVLVQNYFTSIFKLLNGESPSLSISHFAAGSGTSTAVKSDTALGSEVFRKAVTTKTYAAAKFTVKVSLAPSECAFVIKEIGIFANGINTLGSGSLVSRCNVDIDKNSSTQLLITYTITAA